jgi:hypothetical protein
MSLLQNSVQNLCESAKSVDVLVRLLFLNQNALCGRSAKSHPQISQIHTDSKPNFARGSSCLLQLKGKDYDDAD